MTQLAIKATSKFKKDYKAAIKRGLNISLLEAIIKKLANQEIKRWLYIDDLFQKEGGEHD